MSKEAGNGVEATPELVVQLTNEVSKIAGSKITDIRGITSQANILAINAMIESGKAGAAGKTFAVVAAEMKKVSGLVGELSNALENELANKVDALRGVGAQMIEVTRGQRLTDLALNAVELIDRNLYERTCDVRWWATDSAVVDVLSDTTPEAVAYASKRLGVILDAYTVYLDLWIADMSGRVIANGRPDRYPEVQGISVADEDWFKQAKATQSGDDYAVADISANEHLRGATVATYATAIRAGGEANGQAIGVLGIHFDWGPQAEAIVRGVRMSEKEQALTRVMLLDRKFRVIASNDGQGILTEQFPLKSGHEKGGYYRQGDGNMVGFSLTPGYETYEGMGWYGCIVQKPLATS